MWIVDLLQDNLSWMARKNYWKNSLSSILPRQGLQAHTEHIDHAHLCDNRVRFSAASEDVFHIVKGVGEEGAISL